MAKPHPLLVYPKKRFTSGIAGFIILLFVILRFINFWNYIFLIPGTFLVRDGWFPAVIEIDNEINSFATLSLPFLGFLVYHSIFLKVIAYMCILFSFTFCTCCFLDC